ncbi:peptidase M24 family protein [Actinosynnema sp. ALI-1.44]|uniref:M24 family metallopeptidase n=1 Tax=Actinosynnema sp. ALI-1.44 TaxID=1933779 RepID=UPI00097BEA31|nr:Xaa-Pro peptidase family protein [Actinosynnema sp. ALI-1.44]ONI89886.1 peptidase M24 family protein [Actinosynnema sp. ALI-1.44]
MSSSTAPVPAPKILRSRLERAQQAAADAGFDALLVTPGSDLRYLIGAVGGSFERLTCLVLPVSGQATLVVPKLELPGYEHLLVDELGVDAATWVDGVNPAELAAGLLKSPKRVAVSDFTPALHVLGLRDALAGVEQQLAGPVIRELRMRKDVSEIDSLREAGAAIDRVHARMGEFLRAGRTENEVAADIADAIVAEGHTLAEFVIVGSGPNGASPHHGSSDRVIEQGDVVVIDIGGPVAEGYNSDSTRTYAIGTPRDEDVATTYAVLQQAQQAAVDAVRPGVTAQDIDRAARAVIADAGFGEYFIHRTGHGIGLDVHEEPYIVEGNDLVLEEGMAFSVEPGIYQSGRWGARIEDIVVVTAGGVESLNTRPHELVVLGE